MIIAYDQSGKELGRYDTMSDLIYDHPSAEIIRGRVVVRDE